MHYVRRTYMHAYGGDEEEIGWPSLVMLMATAKTPSPQVRRPSPTLTQVRATAKLEAWRMHWASRVEDTLMAPDR